MEEGIEERVCVQKKRSGSIYLYMDFSFVYIIWHGAHTGVSRCFLGRPGVDIRILYLFLASYHGLEITHFCS